jgi:hypothetical protein
MPDVVSDQDLNALAAEFVLGTLDYEERKGATALLEVDHAFRGIVRIWERRLGELHLMVEAVDPGPDIWARIRPQITGIEQVELAIPSNAEASTAAEVAAAHAEASSAAAAMDSAAAPEPASSDAASSSQAPIADMPETAAASTTSTPEGAAESGASDAGEAFMAGRSRSLDETELRLTELAALLPVTGQEHGAPPQPSDDSSLPSVPDSQPVQDQAPELTVAEPQVPEPQVPEPQVPEPEPAAREFVPPAPMAARSVTVLEVPVRKVGRGWIAATLAMGLVAIVLAGLIGAWRYFPERLPEQLGVHSVLNLPVPAPPLEPQPEPPPPFDE